MYVARTTNFKMTYVRVVLRTCIIGEHKFCSLELEDGKIVLLQSFSFIKTGFHQRRESFERLVTVGSKTQGISRSSCSF